MDARMVREYLRQADDYQFDIMVAPTLAAAIAALQASHFDAGLIDLNLTDSQGLETFERIQLVAPRLPVVVLTNYDDRRFATLAVQQGAQDYLVKGHLNRELLVRAILYAIERKRGEEKLKRINDNLNDLVAERTAALRLTVGQLEHEIAERIKAEDIKDDFVSRVSHELRTPLSIIKEGISLMIDQIPGELTPKQEHILKVARRNVERLGRIINDLLNFAKIEAGKLELHFEPFDFCALVAEVTNEFAERAARKGIELRLCLCPHPVELQADRQCIEEVMMNLIGNAVKYTPAGAITVTVNDLESHVECQVMDTGLGIPADAMPRVFGKFEQFHTTGAGGERGTGLGLTISKSLVEMHGGRVSVESTEHVGSTFSFRVPKNQPEPTLEKANWGE